jgi:hypothetical protein
MLSWGNWDIRVDAADAYVSLAHRFGAEQREIVDMFDTILSDAVPEVRLQVAQNLQVLYQIAPERMWTIAELIAAQEQHGRVLGKFLNDVVSRFTRSEPERCEAIVEIVRHRRLAEARQVDVGRDEVDTVLGNLTAQLWVRQARPRAIEWLKAWAPDPFANREFLTSFLSTVRGALVTRYAPADEQDRAISDSAQSAAMIILQHSSAAAEESHAALLANGMPEEAREKHVAVYQAAEAVVHHLMNQLYFGAGAFAHNQDAATALTNPEAMRRFLDDYQPMLALLATSREPGTHQHLVELYEYLIQGDPPGVFDALHALLLGAGAREGYHFEDLASTVIVRMITRYIADYRSIFEDDERRGQLIEVLRLFSDVGWPDALKLLYELPELLR